MKGSVNVPGVSVVDLRKNANEQTPTFTQAETLENISSGEKMSTLMGKIMKAIAELISHLKNGKHVTYSTTAPVMDGTASVGTEDTVARSDHKHPSDTTRAPKSHAAADTTYGAGNGSNYGHVKLSDATNSTSGVNGGVAATPAAVKAAYDLANTANTTANGKAPVYSYGTTDLTAGSSALETGKLHFVYE